MLVGVALQGSELDARGGIVGGAISLSSIDTYGKRFGSTINNIKMRFP